MEGQLVPAASDVEIPPDRIKEFIDRTAEFVAQNGSTAEREIIVKEGKNPIFEFLRIDNRFRPYYDDKVKEMAKLMGKEVF